MAAFTTDSYERSQASAPRSESARAGAPWLVLLYSTAYVLGDILDCCPRRERYATIDSFDNVRHAEHACSIGIILLLIASILVFPLLATAILASTVLATFPFTFGMAFCILIMNESSRVTAYALTSWEVTTNFLRPASNEFG